MLSMLRLSVTTLALALPITAVAQQAGDGGAGHSFDMTIDPAAISETQRLGPRSFSPYANRSFPTRPLWGDQHVHSGWSFDAGFINALGPEDALRFARGEQVETTFGVPIQLSRPLDWLAMTDHSDLLGVTPALRSGDPALVEADEMLARWSQAMQEDIETAVSAAMEAIAAQSKGTLPEAAQNAEFYERSWQDYTEIIERFNEPGRFTAMIGYEWTPNPGPGNNLHRNVIYRGDKAEADQAVPFTTFESVDSEDLWAWMQNYEDGIGGQLLAIPHNGNLSNGLMFAFETYGGEPLTQDYAERRQKWEPIYEVTQIKGDGEAHPSLSPDDEFADFETWDEGNLNLIRADRAASAHGGTGSTPPARRRASSPPARRGARPSPWRSASLAAAPGRGSRRTAARGARGTRASAPGRRAGRLESRRRTPWLATPGRGPSSRCRRTPRRARASSGRRPR
jgi:hypothetical protein